MNELISKLNNKHATIAIIGLGYVGLPLMLRYAEIGYKVIGIDNDPVKSEMLNKGQSYIKHIHSDKVLSVINQEVFATSDIQMVEKADAIILCLPTPLDKYREPDLSFVINTMESISPYLQKNQVLSLESTTYPGTTEEELLPRIEAVGFEVGKDFYLVYSPEREDPGNINFETSTIPKVCGGQTHNCLKVGVALYEQVINEVVSVSSTKVAEMTKLLENVHRAVNIGLVNEMKIIADKMDIDIHEVINAAATKPFGFTPYYPGPGLGGHCIPIDPFYLTWKAKEYNIHTRFIELAGEINRYMPKWVIDKTIEGLNQHKKSVNGSHILILGLAYKPDIDDTRESPAFEIIDLLMKRGASVDYSDPYIQTIPRKRNYQFNMNSVSLSSDNIAKYDAVILVTNHTTFDYSLIQDSSQLIIDTRGEFKSRLEHIIRA